MSKCSFGLVMFTAILLVHPFDALADEITLVAVKDTYIDEFSPAITAGDEELLKVSADWGHPLDLRQKMILIQFDTDTLTNLPVVVKKALLRLHLDEEVPEPGKLEISSVAGAWDENTVRWSTRPLADPDTSVVKMVPLSGVFDVDVTALVDSWVQGRSGNNGFYILAKNGGLFVKAVFASRENNDPSLRPALVINPNVPDSMNEDVRNLNR